MKINIPILISIIFISLSIWLSFSVKKANLPANERVIWLSHKLYDYGKSSYDSELLFVDAEGSILGLLPLALLKTKAQFESWLAPYYSSDDFESSDE